MCNKEQELTSWTCFPVSDINEHRERCIFLPVFLRLCNYLFELRPRVIPESECKSTAPFSNNQTFYKLFSDFFPTNLLTGTTTLFHTDVCTNSFFSNKISDITRMFTHNTKLSTCKGGLTGFSKLGIKYFPCEARCAHGCLLCAPQATRFSRHRKPLAVAVSPQLVLCSLSNNR